MELAVGALAAITLVRLIWLHVSRLDLFFDESQYWAWSRDLAFGYFSKPPLIAWVTAAAEHVCGSTVPCIRAQSPVLFFGTSVIVYAIANELYDARVAFLAALSLALAPGVAIESQIILPDVPLLFFWAAALLAYLKLIAGGSQRWTFVLGVLLGLGLLAKYAMIYFLLGIALAAWLDDDARRFLRTPSPWLALALAALLVAPNLVWNAENGFSTFRHTGDNIKGEGFNLSALRALAFAASQFLVFGPINCAALIAAISRVGFAATDRADRLLLGFAIPPLVLVSAVALVTDAHSNWAAPAYVSGVIVAVAFLARQQAWKWLAGSIAFGLVAQAAVLVSDVVAPRLHVPFVARGDIFAPRLGWRSLGEQAGHLARQVGARTIVGDTRADVASLLYYWRDQPEQIFAWQRGAGPEDSFDLTHAFTAAAPTPILYISECPMTARLSRYFATVEPLGRLDAPTGPASARHYFAFKLAQPRGPIGPRGPCRKPGEIQYRFDQYNFPSDAISER
jgi:4-amino-4-deoxy-L-arabinose transferase-like glycosyltransferase